ncbi:MAG: exodeoxyribonuclease VII small subunit [Rhodobacteraceae bacterium]|nr:exodeoxyribonuclease VII small subunit [Paracoccaceae bacterium]
MTEPTEKPSTEKPVAEMSFEEAMKALEGVVDQLERGDVELEQSIALYERGAALKAHCDAKLKAAEEKVDAITLDADGKPTGTTPVEGL